MVGMIWNKYTVLFYMVRISGMEKLTAGIVQKNSFSLYFNNKCGGHQTGKWGL